MTFCLMILVSWILYHTPGPLPWYMWVALGLAWMEVVCRALED